MKKMIFFWIYFVLAIILAIYFASRILTNQINMGPISVVQDTIIVGNTKNLDTNYIKSMIGITNGTKIKDIYDKKKDTERNKTEKINNIALQIPWVKNASTKFLPNGIFVIKIEPHDIIATWTDGMYYYPLSAEGEKIDYPQETPIENSIVFMGKTTTGLKEIVSIIKETTLVNKIDYITMVESRRWNIYLKNGIIIYLPEKNPLNAVNTIIDLDKRYNILSRDIKVIDLRNNQKILVKTKK